jgi:DnaJ-class molecular chaperone
MTSMPKDYYTVLGVPKDADEKTIRTAYRRLARKFHPDVNPNNPEAEARFKEATEAYDVLSDPEKRKAYDRYGPMWEQAASGGGVDFGQGVDLGPGVDIDLGGLFGNLFGFGGDVFRSTSVEPRDVERSIDVTLQEIDHGTQRTLSYQTEDACATCNGTGQIRPAGQPARRPCPTCQGRGALVSPRTVTIKIPAGFQDGKKLRVPGGGARGSNNRSGDLYVTVRTLPDAQFRRRGEDTEVDVEVPFTLAALGGEIRVPTPRTSGKIRIPAGTQPGQTFRLKGQGISKLGGGRGDLLAKVKVTVPKNLTEEQRKLLQHLDEALRRT